MSSMLYTLVYRRPIYRKQQAGKDGKLSLAILVTNKSATRNADKSMNEYQRNSSVCLRDNLFRDTDHSDSVSPFPTSIGEVIELTIHQFGRILSGEATPT